MSGELAALNSTLAALSITGLVRQYTYPPLSLSTADLPCSFPMPPSTAYTPLTACTDTDDTLSQRLVIVTEAATQNTQAQNYADIITYADRLNQALKDNRDSIGALVSWVINAQDTEPIFVAGNAYWGVSATVTVQG